MPQNPQKPGPVAKLMKALNRSLKSRADFIDPSSEIFLQDVLSDISQEVEKIRGLNEPDIWKRVYIARDANKVRMEILNRIMSMGQL